MVVCQTCEFLFLIFFWNPNRMFTETKHKKMMFCNRYFLEIYIQFRLIHFKKIICVPKQKQSSLILK